MHVQFNLFVWYTFKSAYFYSYGCSIHVGWILLHTPVGHIAAYYYYLPAYCVPSHRDQTASRPPSCTRRQYHTTVAAAAAAAAVKNAKQTRVCGTVQFYNDISIMRRSFSVKVAENPPSRNTRPRKIALRRSRRRYFPPVLHCTIASQIRYFTWQKKKKKRAAMKVYDAV